MGSGFESRGIRHWYLLLVLFLEKLLQVSLESFSCFDRKTGGQRIHGGVGIHFSRVNVEFFSPNQFGLLALFKNGVEKAAKHVETVAGSDTAQA